MHDPRTIHALSARTRGGRVAHDNLTKVFMVREYVCDGFVRYSLDASAILVLTASTCLITDVRSPFDHGAWRRWTLTRLRKRSCEQCCLIILCQKPRVKVAGVAIQSGYQGNESSTMGQKITVTDVTRLWSVPQAHGISQRARRCGRDLTLFCTCTINIVNIATSSCSNAACASKLPTR
jgi:hypothetical protein